MAGPSWAVSIHPLYPQPIHTGPNSLYPFPVQGSSYMARAPQLLRGGQEGGDEWPGLDHAHSNHTLGPVHDARSSSPLWDNSLPLLSANILSLLAQMLKVQGSNPADDT